MAVERRLSEPPIVEALADFRIAADLRIDFAMLEPLAGKVQRDYPLIEEKRHRKASIDLRPEGSTSVTQEIGFLGLYCQTADGKAVAQFRQNGFTFNRLPPYPGADVILDEALRLWDLYCEAVRPQAVTRLALRYINRLILPFVYGDDLLRFLTAPVPGPPDMQVGTIEFLSRSALLDPHTSNQAIVTQKLGAVGPGEKYPKFVLDIDVFRQDAPIEPTHSHLRPHLEALRVLKNRLFFALLTEEAVKLYE